MAYYNFLRPHTALKFGTTVRTPATQAGLAKKRLSFREVFTTQAIFLLFILIADSIPSHRWNVVKTQQQLPEEASKIVLNLNRPSLSTEFGAAS